MDLQYKLLTVKLISLLQEILAKEAIIHRVNNERNQQLKSTKCYICSLNMNL